MRLDKYVSSVTDLSRAQSKKVIKQGQVIVSGRTEFDPRTEVSALATVQYNGQLLRTATHRYYMMNKPFDCVSVTKDRQHMTAIDLLNVDNMDQLHIAGRLDIDTTGLLLITDDGKWSHRVTSPNQACRKTYQVQTRETIDHSLVTVFKQGIKLARELRPTRPAELVLTGARTAELTIIEGKYHQVKRMFAAVGNKVERLHRIRIGSISLDEELQPGEYRPLTAQEVACV